MEVLTALMGSQKTKVAKGNRGLVRDPKTGLWTFGQKEEADVPQGKAKFRTELIQPEPIKKEEPKSRVREKPNFRVDTTPTEIPEFRFHYPVKTVGEEESFASPAPAPNALVVAPTVVPEKPKKQCLVEEEYEEKGDYQVLQSDVLQKALGNLVYVLELHCLAIPLSSPSFSPEFRVFIQQGPVDAPNEHKLTCYMLSSMKEAQDLYVKLYNTKISHKYAKVRLLSTKVGSAVAMRDSPSMGQEYQEMPLPTRGLVEQIFSEAQGWLGSVLKAKITPHGIESTTGVISETQIELGESLLCELLRLFKNGRVGGGKPYLEADMAQVNKLTNDFYSAIPHQTVAQFTTVNDFELKQELLGVMRSLVSVNESRGAVSSAATSVQAKQYQALGCDIVHLTPESEEFHRVSELVLKSQVGGSVLSVVQAFSCVRPLDQNVFRSDLQSKLLFHGTKCSNMLGILSKGLVLPQIAVSKYGGGRWDVGNLGAGIYFSDSATTSITYALPSKRNTRFLVICEVALGKIKEFTTFQQQLEAPPEGFDSVRGVASRHDDFSEFDDDEYVIYNVNQHRMKYIVEFAVKGDPAPLPLSTVSLAPAVTKLAFEPIEMGKATLSEPLDPLTHKVVSSNKVGLLAVGGREVALPLRAVHVRAKLLDLVGEVVLLQHFVNDGDEPIEARYVFPLDESSAVCGFEAFIDGKHVIGVVKEKEVARREYKEAIAAGHGAYLMEEEKPDVFTVNVGNLPPHAEVLIKITYIMELRMEGSDIIFSLPSAIAPSAQLKASQTRQLQDQTETVLSSLKQGAIDVQVALEMPYPVVRIQSLNHDVKTKQAGTRATIEMSVNKLNHDFVLLCALESPFQPRMWVEDDPLDEGSRRACMVSFGPQFASPANALTEILFVLDLSSSMGHAEALADAKVMMATILSNLRNVTCEFNVVGFGSTHELVFPAPVPTTKANLQHALSYVEAARANFGGTDLWKPLTKLLRLHSLLEADLQRSGKPSRLRNLVLISDGQFLSQDALLQLARENSQHTRMFAFGVGTSQSKHALRTLASQGAGQAEFIVSPYLSHKTKNESKLLRQLTRMKQPALRNVAIDWIQDAFKEPPSSFQAPAVIHSVFSGERLIVYGFINNCHSAKLSAQLCGKTEEANESFDSTGSYHTRVDAGLSTVTKGHIVHRLCARAMVRDYEDGIYSDDRNLHEMIKRNKKQRILELGLTYSLVTQFTSFIAIEKRNQTEEEDDGEPEEPPPTLAMIVEAASVDSLPYMAWKDIPATVQFQHANDEEFLLELGEEESFEEQAEQLDFEFTRESAKPEKKKKVKREQEEGAGEDGFMMFDFADDDDDEEETEQKEAEENYKDMERVHEKLDELLSDKPVLALEQALERRLRSTVETEEFLVPASMEISTQSEKKEKCALPRPPPPQEQQAVILPVSRAAPIMPITSADFSKSTPVPLATVAAPITLSAARHVSTTRDETRGPVGAAAAAMKAAPVAAAAAAAAAAPPKKEEKLKGCIADEEDFEVGFDLFGDGGASSSFAPPPARAAAAAPQAPLARAAAAQAQAPLARAAAPPKPAPKAAPPEESEDEDMGFSLFGDDGDGCGGGGGGGGFSYAFRSAAAAPARPAAPAARPAPAQVKEEEESEDCGSMGFLFAGDDDWSGGGGGGCVSSMFNDVRSDERSRPRPAAVPPPTAVAPITARRTGRKIMPDETKMSTVEGYHKPKIPPKPLAFAEIYKPVPRTPPRSPRQRPPPRPKVEVEKKQKKKVVPAPSSLEPAKYDEQERKARLLAKRIHVLSQLQKAKEKEGQEEPMDYAERMQELSQLLAARQYIDTYNFTPVSYAISDVPGEGEGEGSLLEVVGRREKWGPIRRRKKKKGTVSRGKGAHRAKPQKSETGRRRVVQTWTPRPKILRISASDVHNHATSVRDDGALDPQEAAWLEKALGLEAGAVNAALLTLGVRSLGPTVFQACLEALLTALFLAHLIMHWGPEALESVEVQAAMGKAKGFLQQHEEQYSWVWESLDKTALLGVDMKKGDADNWLSLAHRYLMNAQKAADAKYDELHKKELEMALWDASGQSLANSERAPPFVDAALRAAAPHTFYDLDPVLKEGDSEEESYEEEEDDEGDSEEDSEEEDSAREHDYPEDVNTEEEEDVSEEEEEDVEEDN